MSAPRTHAQRLAAEAADAAEVRGWQTHPDVVALRVERIRSQVERLMWTGIVLGLCFTMTNVQQFAAAGAVVWSLGWCAAWLLDPMVSLVLLAVLRAEQVTAGWQVPMGPWPRTAKWSLLSATYVMNTWSSWVAGSVSGIVLHSVPVLTVFMAAEAVTDCQDKLTEAVHRAHAYATQRAERKAHPDGAKQATAKARSASPAPLPGPVPAVPGPPPAAPRFPAVPVRPETTPAVRSAERPAAPPAERPAAHPAGRSADRSSPPTQAARPDQPADRPAVGGTDRWGPVTRPGPVRSRSGAARTDAQLVAAVCELAERNGGTPPSQYQIKQRFGVGSGRAARLLAEARATPAGPPESNGAATRKDGAR